jgi:hypothetical protein
MISGRSAVGTGFDVEEFYTQCRLEVNFYIPGTRDLLVSCLTMAG